MNKPQFVIAAPTSNSGKTTLTLGLLRALEDRNYDTQAFKVGPDYIDPKFHGVANGKQGVNLDLYMMSDDEVQQQYAFYSNQKDVVCVEGVMGLFDGAKKDFGSTASVAKELELPVVLVVNAKSVAYSVAPLLYGFKNFDKNVTIAGVIFNNVNTASHYQFLEEACKDVGVVSFGYVPFVKDCEIPSRHLGLSIGDMKSYDSVIQKIADELVKTVQIDALLKATSVPEKKIQKEVEVPTQKTIFKIAIAKDKSFNFSYIQTVNSFKNLGEVVFFSPLENVELPKVDLVYLPGGYPELYSEGLSKNKRMLQSIKKFANDGGHILAECGGMMYLGKSITDSKGNCYEMANVFEFETSLKNMKLNLGYRNLELNAHVLKGHEFHYSQVLNDLEIQTQGRFTNARGKQVDTKLYTFNNVKASYMHYYLGSAQQIVALCNLDVSKEKRK